MVNWLRSSPVRSENKTFEPLPKVAVTFAGGSKCVLYWNIVAWTMFGGKRFLEMKRKISLRSPCHSYHLNDLHSDLFTCLTKSNSVSAVRTSRVTFSSPETFVCWPSPGRMTVTKMMPRMTAQTVVVK